MPNPVFSCDATALKHYLPLRQRDAHKGMHGHVLCIGGDHGSGGAVILAAQAALRCGAGLVSVATRGVHIAPLLARSPEVMAHAVETVSQLDPLLARASVVALGPGLGQDDWGKALLTRVLEAEQPRVFDADALNLLVQEGRRLRSSDVITPHPGEAARLLGCTVSDVQNDRLSAVEALQQRWGAVVVLKGAGTLIKPVKGVSMQIAAGNPGMAVGGMGDVLTGCIAALIGQGLSVSDAATAGALLHAAAGDAAAQEGGERGLLPSDLLPWLRRLANPVRR